MDMLRIKNELSECGLPRCMILTQTGLFH